MTKSKNRTYNILYMDIGVLDSEKTQVNVPDELTQNYREMDESGKEEFLKETEKILEVHGKLIPTDRRLL